MESVRACTPVSGLEIVNYDADLRPFQHVLDVAPVAASGSSRVVAFRATSSNVRLAETPELDKVEQVALALAELRAGDAEEVEIWNEAVEELTISWEKACVHG